MGYACPVCDVPQQDGEHLANHLAFTAMTHGDEHESWLDEHVPGWASSGPAELAPTVTELAEEAPYEQVFEDTVHDHASHSHGGSLFDENAAQSSRDGPGALGGGADAPGARGAAEVENVDADAEAVFEEAQRLTREMLDSGSEGDGDDANGETRGDDEPDDGDEGLEADDA